MLPLSPITRTEPPREILAADFPSLRGGLLGRGRWGYSKADACVIEKNDPLDNPEPLFNGIAVEYAFVDKRIYEEMIVTRPAGEKYSGIRWNLQTQSLLFENGKVFDRLVFEISGLNEGDGEELHDEMEEMLADEMFGMETRERKFRAKLTTLTREFWFDITSFYRA